MSGMLIEQRQGARHRLADPTLWRALLDTADVPGFVVAWLGLVAAQTDMMCAAGVPTPDGRVVLGGFVALRQDGAQRFGRVGRYGPDEASLLLTRAAERCLQMRRPIVQNSDGIDAPCQLVVPIMTGERLDGAVALELDGGASLQLDTVLRVVQWGLGWFSGLLERGRTDGGAWVGETALAALDLMLQDSSTAAAAQAGCTLLASRFDVARVSLGVGAARGGLEPVGTSGGGLAATPTDFAIALRAAMEEAAQARVPIAYPTADDQLAAIGAHQRLCRSHGSAWTVSLPVACGPNITVVFTVEGESAPPNSEGVARWDAVARAVAPAFVARLRAERDLVGHAAEAARTEMALWRGDTRRNRLVAAGLATLVLIFLVFGRGDYRVSARATLEGTVKRAMVAPFDGYLADAVARPGDRVAAGFVLGRLDDRELKLQLADHTARRAEAQRQADEAIARRDLAQAGISAAHRDQEDAELALIRANLGRTQLMAPFDGIVISGDPAQNIGAPLRRGDIIYEMSPLDSYRVAIDVDQGDFAEVRPGQAGALLLTPLPTRAWPLAVVSVTPLATAREGRTAFRVDATLSEVDPVLRPGMQGIAKIDVGPARYVWIWTHDAVNWVRLRLWEYLP